MSNSKSLMNTKSTSAKLFFVLSIILAGPVSFFLYDYYVQWTDNSSTTITWYLAFAYDAFGAWGGVLLSLTGAAICYVISYMCYRSKRMYYWN